MLNQDYEEISDELLYEVPKDIQPYEEPINALKKEKPYDEPDDTTDQPLESPIYIVPDPEEQNRIENLYQHVNVQNTTTNGEHHVSQLKYAYELILLLPFDNKFKFAELKVFLLARILLNMYVLLCSNSFKILLYMVI